MVVEHYRLNMPDGRGDVRTLAAFGHSKCGLQRIPFSIAPATSFVGQNVLRWKCIKTTPTTNVGLRVVSARRLPASWTQRRTSRSPSSPALPPQTAALGAHRRRNLRAATPTWPQNLNDWSLRQATSCVSPATTTPNPLYRWWRFNQTIPIFGSLGAVKRAIRRRLACGAMPPIVHWEQLHISNNLVTNQRLWTIRSVNPSNGWATIATATDISARSPVLPPTCDTDSISKNNERPLPWPRARAAANQHQNTLDK